MKIAVRVLSALALACAVAWFVTGRPAFFWVLIALTVVIYLVGRRQEKRPREPVRGLMATSGADYRRAWIAAAVEGTLGALLFAGAGAGVVGNRLAGAAFLFALGTGMTYLCIRTVQIVLTLRTLQAGDSEASQVPLGACTCRLKGPEGLWRRALVLTAGEDSVAIDAAGFRGAREVLSLPYRDGIEVELTNVSRGR